MTFDWQPLLLTFRLALITSAILLILGVPLAYALAYGRFRFKAVLATLVSMPLVLPPSVLGFYLLVAFSPGGALGRFLDETFSLRLVFSTEGLIVASVLYSLPFMVQPVQAGFLALPRSYTEAAATLGKSPLTVFFRVLLPNIKASLLTGMVLSFAHTIGEFGVVLMIGGNIPGRTRVASIAIYDAVEAMDYTTANAYALVLFAVSFAILLTLHLLNGRARGGRLL